MFFVKCYQKKKKKKIYQFRTDWVLKTIGQHNGLGGKYSMYSVNEEWLQFKAKLTFKIFFLWKCLTVHTASVHAWRS